MPTSTTLPRLSRAALLRGGLPVATFAALLASACAGSSQASPAATPAPPVPPAQLATVVPTAGATPADQAAPASGPQVAIDNFSFTPATLTVPVGTTVTWTNRDDTPHTVTSSDKALGSNALNTDAQFSYTFDKLGTYNYFCSIHPFMTAKVIVQ